MILKVSANLSDSVILFYDSMKVSVRKIKKTHSSCIEENGLEQQIAVKVLYLLQPKKL